ncbi:MAG: nucleotidyltransferase domain-containing protein [Deltaproteobacteria bacterium]|nr:nucleotidyltransferase domain-containing protein [Deltaproteobacteria bacterium]
MNLEALQSGRSPHLLLRAVVGSRAYGTARPDSDLDIRGVFALPGQAHLALEPPPEQLADAKNDVVFYSLKRCLDLLAQANPNMLELLFLPEDCVEYRSPLLAPLWENRALFITRRAYDSHVGYARAQVKKARGQNKWVNNPQPEVPPAREDFCWVIPPATGPAT